jgi:hypothetical protein
MSEWDQQTAVARTRRSRSRDVTAAVVVALVVGYGVWSLAAVHPGGPMTAGWEPQPSAHSVVCTPDPLDGPVDLTQGIGAALPGGMTILSVHLVGARGVSLVEAKVGTVAMGADGVYVAPGTAVGWPALDDSSMSADSLLPAQGLRIEPGGSRVLVLHLRLDDPRQRPAFDDVAVVYRSGLFRYEARMGIGYQYPPGGPCSQ